eukprot:SAG31_NODE_14177_length_823_cov_1.274862_1_plen_151_part_10
MGGVVAKHAAPAAAAICPKFCAPPSGGRDTVVQSELRTTEIFDGWGLEVAESETPCLSPAADPDRDAGSLRQSLRSLVARGRALLTHFAEMQSTGKASEHRLRAAWVDTGGEEAAAAAAFSDVAATAAWLAQCHSYGLELERLMYRTASFA